MGSCGEDKNCVSKCCKWGREGNKSLDVITENLHEIEAGKDLIHAHTFEKLTLRLRVFEKPSLTSLGVSQEWSQNIC